MTEPLGSAELEHWSNQCNFDPENTLLRWDRMEYLTILLVVVAVVEAAEAGIWRQVFS